MASCNMLFFILVSFLSFATIEGQDAPTYLYTNCPTNATTTNSAFQLNLRTLLLTSLSSSTTRNIEFYNTTVTGKDPSDSVYGLFMCRGDILSPLCHQCVLNATQRLFSECSLSKQAIIWYDVCMVRYASHSFFSMFDTSPGFMMLNTANVSNPERFLRLLSSTMNQTAEEAARPPIGAKKFATKKATVSGLQNLYCLAQCTQDLSPPDCRDCLRGVIGDLPSCCVGKQGGRIQYPSCNIRFELYPFYRSISASSPTPAPALIPETNNPNSKADTRDSQDPFYLSQNCTSNQTIIDETESTFQISIKLLLSYLSSNATSGETSHKADVADTFFGFFMCRGDIPTLLCQQCVENATHKIKCPSFQDAIIWYSHCMLRYSYHSFFSTVNTSPMYSELNVTGNSSTIPGQNFFTETLSNLLAQLATETGDSDERYKTKSSKLNDVQTLYTLGQCTQDLSSKDCQGCLEDVIGTAIPWSSLGSIGGRVLYPSCNLRFEMFQFYRDADETVLPNPPGDTDSKRQQLLSWAERYNIIGGIARGILYLHEHSRLKVIHRDLKPSNILLDEDINPKISDFGLARIVEISQDQGSTNRIVGTLGYMSPEYAMLGQFSEKSDVFSFGVMILEIVAGKKNLSSYELHRVADGLLNHVWRQWRNQTPLSILDPNIKDDYSTIEVIKCIQIGLLCIQHNPDARPTMVKVVSYLSSDSIELPTPLEPAFFLHGRMDSKAVAKESSSTGLSINEMSISTFLPR